MGMWYFERKRKKNWGKHSESFDHFMTLCVVKIRHDSSGYFVGKRYSLLPNKWIVLNITLPLLEWLAMFFCKSKKLWNIMILRPFEIFSLQNCFTKKKNYSSLESIFCTGCTFQRQTIWQWWCPDDHWSVFDMVCSLVLTAPIRRAGLVCHC